jgi:hypothetical protein
MKKMFTTFLGAAMMLATVNAAVAFNKYPPGPGATCTDTLTIFQVRSTMNTVAACAPQTGPSGAIGDTVLGVSGIITGFDENPTGFDIYIQNSAGGPFTGIDVFTHGTNLRAPYGFNLGDSMVVEYARCAIFAGDPELEAPNNNFSAPNIILRKVNSGNALPPFFEGNTTDFVELPTNATFPPYVGALMKLDGPVRVARTVGLSFHGMLVVRDAAPSDSVFIDEAKLSTLVPPAVGTILTSVSGIGNSATRGFRIMPRGAADIVDAQPPGITDGYAVADNQYRVVFDRDVTPLSATNPGHYSLASFGSVDAAAMDGASAVILTVSSTGLSHGDPESVTADSIVGTANSIMMTTPVSANFLAGVLTCGEMSAPDPDSLAASPCRDKSRYAGTSGQFINGGFGPRSTFTGIVVGIYGNLYYMEDPNPDPEPFDPPGGHRGITVFAPPVALTLGHEYVISGADEEFYSENEFAAIVKVTDVGNPGVPAPIPLLVGIANRDTCDAGQVMHNARDYLSELIVLKNVKAVRRFNPPPSNGFHVAGPAPDYPDTIFCENVNTVLGANDTANVNYPALGSNVNVVGVVHYTTNTSSPSFRVAPRSPADITFPATAGVGGSTPTTLSFSVYPNPARSMTVSFALPKAADVQLGVYDIAGRRVALLASGSMPAGPYQKVWKGLDDKGNKVNTGMYFYRLRAGDEVRTLRTILLAN